MERNALSHAASVRQSLQNVTAVFSPSAGIHTALTDDNFTAIKVDGYDFQQILGNWYFGCSDRYESSQAKRSELC